jgi:hypothetical protein
MGKTLMMYGCPSVSFSKRIGAWPATFDATATVLSVRTDTTDTSIWSSSGCRRALPTRTTIAPISLLTFVNRES